VRRCAFCQGDADRELWGELVCQRCAAAFWRLGERMTACAGPRCEACGRAAVDVVDGHALCAACHAPVADVVREQVLALGMSSTLDAIRRLPEASA
jgi:hypothetical protein